MEILNKKLSNQKEEEVVTVYAYDTGEYTVHFGWVKCPECDTANLVERDNCPPKFGKCQQCNKQFNIEWE